MEQEIWDKEKGELTFNLYNTLTLFFDERSFIAQLLLGWTDKHNAQTAHGGGHITEDWGGIPTIALFGDDYQLPPPFGLL